MIQRLKETIAKNTLEDNIEEIALVDIDDNIVLSLKRIDNNTWVTTIDKKKQVVQIDFIDEYKQL